MEDRVELEILKQKFEDLKSQHNRFISHLDSEQRVSIEQGKRIDANMREIGNLEKRIERHDITLFNTGRGVVMDVDRLKQQKEGSKYNLALIIAVIATLLSIYTAFFK